MLAPLIKFPLPAALAAILCVAGCRPAAKPTTGAAPVVSSSEDGSTESSELDLDKQKYIWAIEHTAFELEKKFGAPLVASMGRQDIAAVRRFFRPGFSGVVRNPKNRTEIDLSYIREIRDAGGSEKGSSVNAGEMAAHLCSYFDDFEKVGGAKCRVLDLRADNSDPQTGNWTATLLLTGAGQDAQGAPLEFESRHILQCRFENDEAIAAHDIVVGWVVQSEKFRSSTGPLFEEVTESFGLADVDIRDNWKVKTDKVRQYYSQMAVEDFNRDGFLDIAIASANGRWRLLASRAGRAFRDATTEVGLPPWADEQPRSQAVANQVFLAAWIDFDNDDFPDLLLGDRLFHNRAGRAFEDVTDISGLRFNYNPKGCIVADYDCDGLLDLYVLHQDPPPTSESTSDAPPGWVGDDNSGAENQLWKNLGGGRFLDVTKSARAGGGRRQSFAAVWLHANHDHYPDLYIANDFGANVFLLNDGKGGFQDVSRSAGVVDFATSMGVAAGDITGNGSPDIYVANMYSKMGRRIIAHITADDYPPGVFEQIRGACAGNRLYSLRPGQTKFEEISEDSGVNQVGWAYAPALADFDRDGLLDIYAATGFLSYDRHKPDG